VSGVGDATRAGVWAGEGLRMDFVGPIRWTADEETGACSGWAFASGIVAGGWAEDRRRVDRKAE
jgi:hypothetical protein